MAAWGDVARRVALEGFNALAVDSLSPAGGTTPLSWADFAAGISIGPDSWPSTEGLKGPAE